MNLSRIMETVKKNPDCDKAGMILCHNGIVRKTSRDGRSVSGLKIMVDHEKLDQVINACKKKPGIIEALVEINENKRLGVGDDVMFLVVAGDIRDNVVPALSDALNAIKTTVTSKTEYF